MSERTRTFPTTDWTLISDAALEGSRSRPLSLNELVARYMPAIREYLRRRQRVSEDVIDDLVQDFASEKLLTSNFLAKADPRRGRFRTYLVRALENYLIDQLRREGCRPTAITIELDCAPTLTSPSAEPSWAFDLAWAESVMAEAIRRAEERCRRTNRVAVWELFVCRTLECGENGKSIPYSALVEKFGFDSPVQVANALTAAKRIFERMLRLTLRDHAGGGPDVDVSEELADLQKIFARASA